MTTLHRVRTIVADKFKREPSTIGVDTHLFDDLKADSLDTIEIVMELEAGFGIEIDEQRIAGPATIQNLVDLVDELTTRRN